MISESLASTSLMRIVSCSSTYQFKVDYSKIKDLPIGEFISSPAFTIDGYDWVLEFYPQGNKLENQGSHISLFLRCTNEAKDLRPISKCGAIYKFEALNTKGESAITFRSHTTDLNHSSAYNGAWGTEKFIDRAKMGDLYQWNSNLHISCNIRTLAEPRAIKNDPGGLGDHMEKLWERREGFDVTFEVEGESIPAHRVILAARSPVFQAKFYGSMAEAKMERIKIDEMKADVFKALLHFIYTDNLAIDESSDDKTLSVELLEDLFVAADRYALEKLTLLCEKRLVENLSVDTVLTILLLADRHSCTGLKNKCFEFASGLRIFSLIATTESYLHIMSEAPALFAELSQKVRHFHCPPKMQTTG